MLYFHSKNNKNNLFCRSIKTITDIFLIETKKNTGLKKIIVGKKNFKFRYSHFAFIDYKYLLY